MYFAICFRVKVAVNDEETADMLGTFNQSSHRYVHMYYKILRTVTPQI